LVIGTLVGATKDKASVAGCRSPFPFNLYTGKDISFS